MVDRESATWSIDPAVKERFKQYVIEQKGQYRGEAGRLVENALREYMDNDRYERIEKKQGEILERLEEIEATLPEQNNGHTHTQTNGHEKLPRNMGVLEKAEAVIEEVEAKCGESFKERDLEQTIKRLIGGDSRTIEKYKSEIKSQQLAFKFPKTERWLLSEETWFLNLPDFLPAGRGYENVVTERDVRKRYGYSKSEWGEKWDKHTPDPEDEQDSTQADSSGTVTVGEAAGD